MRIHSTKKLLDELPFVQALDTGEEEDSLYSWHANILTINRRKTVVLMNDQNRYVIVLHGLKAKDFKDFDTLVKEAIRQAFKAERIRDEIIEAYLKAAGDVSFHKTKNRSMVARLKQACDHVWAYTSELHLSPLINARVGKKASRLLVGDGQGSYVYPHEELRKDLSALSKHPIFSTNVAVMNASLALGNHSIWRKLIVPLDMSFSEFHQILQIAFDWHNAHLHEFYLYENQQINQPKLNIVMDHKALEYGSPDVDMKLEEGLLLADFIPSYSYIKYIYDFGDDWQHDIVVEEVLTEQDVSSPICVGGEGTAPPEDCGGELGFEWFLEVMNDPLHPVYEEMKAWAGMQLHAEFDLDKINGRLKDW